MTSDLQPMYALTFGSMLIYHIIISRLVYTGLYCCYILSSSADCLYIIIYIGHIANCLNPIAIGWYRHRLELLHRLISRSAV
ncbi:Os09g0389000 [Oryza sativa Japonica Group]|uniref:Os09g0389000 protein n=1 Tax=Oryza sativa subsp. japonica TaxID=39947 RepID=A0A0P0XMJ2_ORYSJ|nr:Os09g0389000 [Oryza sativa Japonica Group]